MNKRHYQLLALAILIGAPLLVSALNSLIPHEESDLAANEAGAARPDYMTPAADPIADLPVEALPDPPQQQANSYRPPVALAGGATLDPTPLLDPSAAASMPAAGFDPAAPPPVVPTAPSAPPPQPQPALAGAAVPQQATPPRNMMPKFREGPLRPY